jgi:effector-binding domain-containing protein
MAGRNGIAPSGPPFIRYLVIDMAAELEIELAVPTGAPVAGSGRVRPGVLPEGRYAVLRHTGPYDGLIAANAALQQWAPRRGVRFDTRVTFRSRPSPEVRAHIAAVLARRLVRASCDGSRA